MSRIELPPNNGKNLERFIEEAMAKLPIAGCAISKNSLPGGRESWNEIEYHAPEGKAFRIIGEFELSFDSNDVSYSAGCIPEPSLGLFERRKRDKIDDDRLNQGISYEEALDEYVTSAREGAGNGDALPHEFFGGDLSVRDEFGQPIVCIKGPVWATEEGAFSRVELPIAADSEATQTYIAEEPFVYYLWRRVIASGLPSACWVELVDHQAPKPELYVRKLDSSLTSLWTPQNTPEAMILGSGRAARNSRGFVIANTMPDEAAVEILTSKRPNPEDLPS